MQDVLVDGISVGAVTTYTFTNVTAVHTISATFAINASSDIVASAGANGSISPNGTTAVACGANQTYTITANSGYAVSVVTVDGSSVGAVSSYTFTNVTATHTISVSFVPVTITTSVLIPNFICPGAVVSVPYTISNSIPSTTFSAQLSDASGVFVNTTSNIIGTLTSTTNGTISATIPSSTVNGSGYRIRVLTSTIIGTNNTQNITIQYSTATALSGFSTETMGAATSTTAIATYETANGFINTGLTMSGTGDIRNTTNSTGYSGASGGANVFITNTTGIYFQINGINTLGVSPVLITLGVYKNSTSDVGSGLGVSVSSDGTTFSAPVALSAIAPLPSGSAAWSLVKLAGIIPSSSTAAIKFVQLGSTVQYRLDDINVYYGTATVPSITPNAPPSQCGGTVTLTANPNLSNAASVIWSNSATTSSISVGATGNYSATVTDGFGCVSNQGPVNVNITIPLATSVSIANSSTTVCSGVSNTFTATPVNGGTPFYQWRVNGGAVGTNSNTYTAPANSLGNGDAVTVDMTTSLTCVTSATVSSNPLTAQKLAYSPTAVWTETFGTSTTTNVATYGSYTNAQGLTFTGSPSGYPEIRTSQVSPVGSGASGSSNMYFATIGTAGATVSLDINGINTSTAFPNILSFWVWNDGFVLSNSSSFTVSYSTDGTNYFPLNYGPTSGTLGWYFVTINNALPKANNLHLKFTQSGSIQARIDDLKLTAYSTGDASITPSGTINICSPATQTLNALPNPGSGLTYAWSNSTSGTSILVSSTSTSSVTLTDVFGCQSSASQLVTVSTAPTAGITGTTTACGSVSLTATGAGVGGSYAWSGGATPSAAANTFAISNTYTVTVTNSAGCTATASAVVTVNPLPTSAGIIKTPSGTQFTGSVLTIVSTPVGGTSPYTYSWASTPANGSIASAPVSGTMASGATGTFNSTVTNSSAYNVAPPTQSLVYGITVTDGNGCSISATTNVRVNPNIQTPQGAASVCQGTVSSTYTTSTVMPLVTSPATSGYTGFDWSLSPAGAGTISTAGVVTWNSGYSGNATVSVLAKNTSATPTVGTQPSVSMSTIVTINPTPTVTVIVSPSASICNGSTVTLSGAGANSYSWSLGVVDATPFTPVSTTTYTVTGTDNNGCSSTASQTVTLTTPPTWYLDADGDLYSNGTTTTACVAPVNYYAAGALTALSGDCNDNNATVYPGAAEICGNGVDEDCNGSDLVCVGVNTWKGGSTVWGSAANWTIAVPTSSTNGLIPTIPVSGNNFPVITSAVAINNLTVQAGATVTVNNTAAITVNGALANAGTFTIKNGGNFLQSNSSTYTGAGTFTVEKLISNTANGYRDISSPVVTTVADLADDFAVFGQNGVKCWYSYSPYPNVQTYNEALSIVDGNYYEGWESRTGLTNSLPALKGVAIRTYQGAPFTLDFTGKPNNGAKTINITNTPSATTSQDGWNFVGNAYPSNIDWVTVAAMNPSITGSYYLFGTTDEYTGAWGTCNASGACTGTGALSGISRYISSGQGFFVKKSAAGTGSFVMDNTVRTATATNFYKTDVLDNEIRLTISNGTNNDEILAYTDVSGTTGNDQGLDAEKMAAGSTVYISYAMPDAEYAINVMNEITEQTELPLIVWVKDNGTYSVAANSLNTPGLTAYLKDASTNILYDLTTNSPSFTLVGNQIYSGRFSVVFTASPTTSVIGNAESATKIYSNGNQIFVERGINAAASISVSNLLGQRIAEVNTAEMKTTLTMHVQELSYVFVKVTEGSKVSVAKVLISNK